MSMYELKLSVRDHECDLQGIVNNAVYLNYLEHARHKFLQTIGSDFAQMHFTGVDALVIRVEIDYRYPLKSGDDFIVTLNMERERKLKLVFFQDIFRLPDKKIIATAKTYVACIKNGKPIVPEEILRATRKKYPDFE